MVFGDLMFDFDFKRLKYFHLKNKSDLTLVTHPNDHPKDSDLVGTNNKNQVVQFFKKPHKNRKFLGNLSLSGIFMFNKKILSIINKNSSEDFCKKTIPTLIKNNFKIFSYNTREYIKDAGTIKRVNQVNIDFRKGLIKKYSIKNKLPAIFLDKDGVLNKDSFDGSYQGVKKIYPHVKGCIKRFKLNGYLVVIVTNQPAIAKGFVKEEKVQKDFRYLENILSDKKSFVDRIYYCPCHPHTGFINEIKKYKRNCSWRKPNNGMLETAIKDLNINVLKSIMLGDRQEDYSASRKSKIRFYYINPKENSKRIKNFKNLLEFSKFFLKR